jgi:hypothetical protein
MKKELQIIYGFNPFCRPCKYFPVYYSEVWLVGVDGNGRCLARFNCDDRLDRGTSWRNGALTAARKFAEKESKFYGAKIKRFESKKEVPRSFNYSKIVEAYNEKSL